MSALDELALLPSSAVCRDRPEYLSRCSSVLSVVGFESPAMNGRGNSVDSAAFGVVFPKRCFSGCPLQTFEDERNKFGSNDAVREDLVQDALVSLIASNRMCDERIQ